MSKNKKLREGIVYSTNPDHQYAYEGDEEAETLPPNQQTLYLRRENRNGKPAVIVKEFIGSADDLKELEKLNKIAIREDSTDSEEDQNEKIPINKFNLVRLF